jgi:hypothetical protein
MLVASMTSANRRRVDPRISGSGVGAILSLAATTGGFKIGSSEMKTARAKSHERVGW